MQEKQYASVFCFFFQGFWNYLQGIREGVGMPSLRRFLLRRYRLFAPYLFRDGLLFLVLLLVGDGITSFYFPQVKAALSLNAPLAASPTASAFAPTVAA